MAAVGPILYAQPYLHANESRYESVLRVYALMMPYDTTAYHERGTHVPCTCRVKDLRHPAPQSQDDKAHLIHTSGELTHASKT